MEMKPNWLPELEGTMPEEAYGYAVSMYSITYEAWRRGLHISFENVYSRKNKYELRYSISSQNNTVKFNHTTSSLTSNEAIKICSNKQRTRETLEKAGIKVPKGLLLKSLETEKVKKETENLEYPLVVKPLSGHGGRGVITDIHNFEELIENIEYINKKLGHKRIIVEEYIKGEDYRAFVIGGQVVGAFRRLPPHVIGDGIKNIKQLLKDKNEIRAKIPGTYNLKVYINEEIKRELKKQKLTLETIPKKGQFVRLKTKSNVSSGGDPIDATDELTEELKTNLVKAVEVIPGLHQGGVDVIYDENSGKYAILEINTKPSIRNHLYPIIGNAHEIPKAMIDYYFPETTGKYLSETTPKYYFDYKVVKEHILNNRIKSISIPDHPYEPNLVSKEITFKLDQNAKNIRKILRRNYHKFNFNGEANQIGKNQYRIIVAGNYQDIKKFIEILKSNKAISNVRSKDYNSGIRLGFTFNETTPLNATKPKSVNNKKPQKNTKNSNVLREDKIEISKLQNEVSELEKEVRELKNSKSWKVTAPLRRMRNKIKK